MNRFIPAAAAAIAAAAGTFLLTSGDSASSASSPEKTTIRTVSGADPTARLTLLDLRRTGPRVVTAKLRLEVVRDTGLLSHLPELHGRGEDGTAEGLRLYDDAAGRTLMPVRDPDGGCSCSRGLSSLRKGDEVAVFARFPAPAPHTRTITLDAPGFPPFYDVPISGSASG